MAGEGAVNPTPKPLVGPKNGAVRGGGDGDDIVGTDEAEPRSSTILSFVEPPARNLVFISNGLPAYPFQLIDCFNFNVCLTSR